MDKKMDQLSSQVRDSLLSIDHLMENAVKKTGLKNWGEGNFQYPLRQLLNFFAEEFGNNTNKCHSFAYTIIEVLTKRLYVQAQLDRDPGIQEIPVTRPLFITGLPRTGTTLMHNLISQDPDWRVLLYWELLYPYDRPDIANFEKYAINLTEKGLQALYAMKPEFLYRHETRATGPEECFNLIRLSVYSIAWANEWYIKGYLKWFLQQDMTGCYRYYKILLQLLLRRKACKHLLLKCPAHLFTLHALFNVFTDANVIWMHRNPKNSIASGLSLLSVFHDIKNSPDEFIELYLEYFRKSLENAIEIEKTFPTQFKSIGYKALIADPLNVIRDVYEQFHYPWNAEKEKNISKWLMENPQHKHGVHKYRLEDFGLSEVDIENRFAKYYDRYGHLL
ncbi:MAG: sulfotransferase [Acidobacteria bacterium]|jgi:hypothetical protein|nr:sulfotransferase [Acidobacteriota bacterium]